MTLTAEEKINDPAHEIHEDIKETLQNVLPRLILNMAALKVGLDGVEKAFQSPYPITDPNCVI
jgi:hypothetical protein